MSQKYEKLKTLLKDLFQLDLDFGLYRVMHAKSGEITQFLDKDLLPQVKQAFGAYQSTDRHDIEQELAKLIATLEAAGSPIESSTKVAELRAKLANESVDIGKLESEVYGHLYSFFRRYYSEGDFLANTPAKAMELQWSMTKNEMQQRNILFQLDDEDTYINQLLKH